MVAVYCHLDYSILNATKEDQFSSSSLPEYALLSFRQLRHFNSDLKTYLICNKRNLLQKQLEEIENDLKIEIVEQDDLLNDNVSELTKAYRYSPKVDLDLVNFNFVGIARYFLVENLMKQKHLEDVFYLEYDNLIYADLKSGLEKVFSRNVMLHSLSSLEICSGTAFFKNAELLHLANEKAIETIRLDLEPYLSDQFVYNIVHEKHPTLISFFRTFTDSSFILDPADFGQYLGGNNLDKTPGFVNEKNFLGMFLQKKLPMMQFFRSADSGKIGFVLNGKLYLFASLHIHNKSAIPNFKTYGN